MDCASTDARIICTKRIVRYEVNCKLDEDGVFANRPSMNERVIREEEMLYRIAPIPTFNELDSVKMDDEEYRVETIRYNADEDANEVVVNKVVVEHENKEEAEKELLAKDKVWSKQCFAMDEVATMFVEMLGKQVGRMDYAKVSAFLKVLKSYDPVNRQPSYYSYDRAKKHRLSDRLIQECLAVDISHNHSHPGVIYEQ